MDHRAGSGKPWRWVVEGAAMTHAALRPRPAAERATPQPASAGGPTPEPVASPAPETCRWRRTARSRRRCASPTALPPAGTIATGDAGRHSVSVRAVTTVLTSRLRRRAGATVALAAVVAFSAAIAIAAVAAARRTDAALPAFQAANHPNDALVFSPDPTAVGRVRALPEVTAAARIKQILTSIGDPARPGGRLLASSVALDPGGLRLFGSPIVTAGRLPRESDAGEVAVDEELALRARLRVGSMLTVRAYTEDQVAAAPGASEGLVPGAGPPAQLRVVGIVRQPSDLYRPPGGFAPGSPDHSDLYLTPSWARGPGAGAYGYGPFVAVLLRHGAADISHLQEQVQRDLGSDAFAAPGTSINTGAGTVAAVARAAGLQSRALQAFAGLVLVAAVFVVGQMMAREQALAAPDDATLRVLGCSRRQLVGVATGRFAVAGVIGAFGSAGLAVALSPLAPMAGTATRRAELNPGVRVDLPVLGAGALATVLVVTGLAALVAAAHQPRTAGRPVTTVRPRSARPWGSRRWVVPRLGANWALARRAGVASVPVRSALAAGAVAVAVAVGVATVLAALDRVLDQPALYGVTWDAVVGNFGSPAEASGGAARLQALPGLRAWSGMNPTELVVEGRPVEAMAVRADHGALYPRIVAGSPPVRASEIALGRATMAALHVSIGDQVDVGIADLATRRFTVSGMAVMNDGSVTGGLIRPGTGAVIAWTALRSLDPAHESDPAEGSTPQVFLVRAAPGPGHAAALAGVRRVFPTTFAGDFRPPDLIGVNSVRRLPALLALVVAALALGAIGHALVMTGRHRRGELAVLRALGLRPVQVAGCMVVQAVTLATVAAAAGIPLGWVVGRATWRVAVHQLGVAGGPELPAGQIVAIAATATVLAAAVGVPVALRARRRARGALRAE